MSDLAFEFELYRLRMEKPRQKQLFENFPERDEVIKHAITSKPSIELRQTVKWHIGNVESSPRGWIYFLIGKTSLRKQEHYDKKARDFINALGEQSPFTYAVLNPADGILGIAKRSKLSARTQTVANRLERMLNSSEQVMKSHYTAVIKDISDPHGFIGKVRAAYAVKRFKFWVSPTNPIDIDRRFHQPNKDLVDQSGATEGVVSLQGAKLDKQIILATASSVNSVGDDARASIQQGQGKKPITVNLKGNPTKVSVTEEQIANKDAEVIIADAYERTKTIEGS